jgi:carboxylesterase
MGGLLAVWLATRHDDLAGIACINAVVEPAGPMGDLVDEAIAAGTEVFPGIGSDIADPDSAETSYPGTPLRALRTLLTAVDELQPDLGRVTCPVLVLNSPEDHVVPPSNSDHLARLVAGPVERVTLERSYHVATLDFDKEIVEQRIVDFAIKTTT